MSLMNPIIKPSQVRRKLEWTPLEVSDPTIVERWKTEWWSTFYEGELDQKSKEGLELRDKLLGFGGSQACVAYNDEDLEKIMKRGEYLPGHNAAFMKGEPSQCHCNSALLWEANQHTTSIMTGYALSEDGMWRQHSWVVRPLSSRYRVYETTEPRLAYFGYVMTVAEAKEFLSWY